MDEWQDGGGGRADATAEEGAEQRASERRALAAAAVTRALLDAASEEEVIARSLAGVGGAHGWRVGSFWRPAGEMLVCSAVWVAPELDRGRVSAGFAEFRFVRGQGLPGRVWARREPEWITDATEEAAFPRGQLAADLGLGAAVAFPVFAGRELVGVMEFFARDPIPRDADLVRALTGIGSELGQYIRRIRAEEQLRASELRYRTLAETAMDAIVSIDGNSVIRYANPAVERIFGYTAEELKGQPLSALMPARMRERHQAALRRYALTGERRIPWSGVELPGLHRDGHEIPLEISFGEFTAGGERLFTGIIRDISERMRQQQELEQATAELEVSVEELEARTAQAEAASRAKTDFLAAMSHELRTPLQAVIGYAGLLVDGIQGELSEVQRTSAERIQASAEHLLGLIDQVLEVSRAEIGPLALHCEPVDLPGIVRDTGELLRPRAEGKGLDFEVTAPDDPQLAAVSADPGRVRQILFNLIGNAIKFTADGSIGVEVAADDGRAVMRVTDTGIGIPQEQVELIFEPFFQSQASLSRRYPGIGLGLAISRELATAMNGDIEVESMLEKGSRFTFWLPLRSA